MDPELRNTPALIRTIDRHRDDLIKRYETIVRLARVKNTDRSATAITQLQMQVETASLIRAAEDLQVLVRKLQETWLFGQLDTLDDEDMKARTDEKAREVAQGLAKLFPAADGEETNEQGREGGEVGGEA